MATPPVFTAGQVLTAAQMNAAGMWLVAKSSTIASGTIVVSNCFTSDFDSYKIVISNLNGAAAANTKMDFYDGANYTSSGFYATRLQIPYNSTTVSGVNVANNAADCGTGIVVDSTPASGGVIEIQNAFLTERTTFQILGSDPRAGGNGALISSGFHNADTSFTGFRLKGDGTNLTAGTIRVYGYRN